MLAIEWSSLNVPLKFKYYKDWSQNQSNLQQFHIAISKPTTMSEQEASQKSQSANNLEVKQNEQDNDDGQNLFNDIVVEDEQKQSEKKSKKLKKLKKSKKDKKDKKDKKEKKKKRKHEDDEQDYGYGDEDDEQEDRNSMFDDEAESDDQENYDDQEAESEFGVDNDDKLKEMMSKPRAGDQFMKRFQGKNDRDINALYSRGANMLRQNEIMYPGQNDPKIFIVHVTPRHEDEIVIFLLNKAKCLAEKTNKVTVITATAIKKKYSGKIFVQAFSQKDVRDSLEGFTNVMLGKDLVQLKRQDYVELFNEKHESKVDFEQLNFVRINKGLYEGDLAQIIKIKAKSVDVTVVPRLNIQQIAMKIRQHTSKIADESQKRDKMKQLLNLFLEYKSNPFKKRPQKQLLTQQELKQQFGENPAVKNINLSGNPPGLIILSYRFDELSKNQGTYRPVEVMPFTTEGNFIGKMTEQKGNLTTATHYKKGEQVEIVSGGMVGHYGVIYQVKDDIAVIVCKNKELRDQKIEEPVENIMKKFKQGQRVKVIAGIDTGKTGIILKIQQKTAEIWTDNQNSLRINKKNLQVSKAETICQQNVHNLKKDDLIKTSKNQIGIVLQTTKDNIKILDTNNTVQIISNMDYDSKINTRNIVAKNKSGEEISAGALIIIRNGVHEGKKCKVIHVYRQNVFIFNAGFNRTAGVSVQNAENCGLISKNEAPQQRSFSAKSNQAIGGLNNGGSQDEIMVGKTITLRSGPLKGYQGVVKSINKDKIEVRVLSKACTQWVPRENITAKQETFEIGKTPNRKGGNTHNYVPSPSRY